MVKERKPKIELVSYTPDPEITIINAARICWNSKSDSVNGRLGKKDAKLLRNLIKIGHYSVLEHASYSIKISNISRVSTHQLVRHRIASYSQRSQRYVKEDGFGYIIPEKIKNSKYRKDYEETMKYIEDLYTKMINDSIPGEDARYLLPNACCSEIAVTMNAREWLHFLKLREDVKAQWEIRNIAKRIHKLLKRVSPNIFGENLL